jgi:hypothetical protein
MDDKRREYLVICDAKSLEVVDRKPLVQSGVIPAHYFYDETDRRLYAAHLDKALVNVWAL